MRQDDAIVLQKSEGLKVINLPNTINRPQKFRYPGHLISLGSVTMLHIQYPYHHNSSTVSPPSASHVEALPETNVEATVPLLFFFELPC